MVRLRRTVRFTLNLNGSDSGSNGHGGVPTLSGLGIPATFDITCRGTPDPATGYLINIKEIDAAARETLLPALQGIVRERRDVEPAALLADLLPALANNLGARFPGSLASVRWLLTPTCSVEMDMAADSPNGHAILRQRCEFAASHRLHLDSMDAAQNRAFFGMCNNPNGHGHNYVIEPAIAVPTDAAHPGVTVEKLEDAIDRAVLERFDHTHLNLDTAEFGPEGVNPSVENIAKVCFELLREELRPHSEAQLRSVTVWETERTSCTYPA